MATTVLPGRSAARGRRLRPALVLLAAVLAATGTAAFLVTSQRAGNPPATTPESLARARATVAAAARTNDAAAYDEARAAVAMLGTGPREDVVRGVLALSLHDFAGAARLGERALSAAPGNPDALTVVVDAQVELGRYDDAQRTLEELLARRPAPAALARLSYVRELRGDLRGAADAMDAATRDAADTADRAVYQTLLGMLQLHLGDLDAASASFAAAERENPAHLPARLGSALVLDARGDRDGALAALGRLADESPQPAVATQLGTLQALAGDSAEAQRSFDLVRAHMALLDQAGVRTDLEVAAFEVEHGDPARAVTDARRAYDQRPTVFAASTLAGALNRAGRPAEAVRYAEESLSLGTRTPSLRLRAAAAFAALGDLDAARTQLAVALDGTPWTEPGLVPLASDLAARLDVPLPATWRP